MVAGKVLCHMNDPYKILGVSPDATDAEVKKAYHNLARKYHPDKYRDTDLAEMAGEKMKEVNAAYEEIQKLRAGGGQRNTNGSGGAYTGGQTYQSNAPWPVQVRQLINLRRIAEAERILAGVNEQDRGAEWNFLMGCVAANKGFFVDAQNYFDIACGQAPDNAEYRNARERLKNRNANFGTGNGTQGSSCSVCDLCAGLMCADCLCDMMRCC